MKILASALLDHLPEYYIVEATDEGLTLTSDLDNRVVVVVPYADIKSPTHLTDICENIDIRAEVLKAEGERKCPFCGKTVRETLQDINSTWCLPDCSNCHTLVPFRDTYFLELPHAFIGAQEKALSEWLKCDMEAFSIDWEYSTLGLMATIRCSCITVGKVFYGPGVTNNRVIEAIRGWMRKHLAES